MKRILEFVWPVIGVLAVVLSLWLLYGEFHGMAIGTQVLDQMRNLPPQRYLMAVLATVVAYAALAWYDRIALRHLGINHISLVFVSLCSFTTYAIAHNIGATVFSGAMVRYRAYSTQGMTAPQVAVLVALCSLTFFLGTLLVGGLVLVLEPTQLHRLGGILPDVLTDSTMARIIGVICLSAVGLYIVGSVFHLKPLVIRGFRLEYPRPGVTFRQLIAAPLELLGAAGIIYYALPEAGNPGYFVVLGVFLASFSAALASNAPGGLGVFELLFLKTMPAIPQAKILAALLVFRFLYLLLPLAISLVIVLLFERNRLKDALTKETLNDSAGKVLSAVSLDRPDP
ncbi:YbhN family protein [Beijerinckia mobilis]|uniref:YbhN family protein n=1 Tax=Beijerinckia mobilis TaxID=231434 RepID=UPI000691B9C9|nr:YbhN family protein [Beijerinckia mobilis]